MNIKLIGKQESKVGLTGLSMGHIYLSHPIAIYACPIPWDSITLL